MFIDKTTLEVFECLNRHHRTIKTLSIGLIFAGIGFIISGLTFQSENERISKLEQTIEELKENK